MYAILYWFSQNFACGSELWSAQCLLFLKQIGSRYPILEVSKFQLAVLRLPFLHGLSHRVKINQCRVSTQLSTKLDIDSGFTEVQIPVSLSTGLCSDGKCA